MRRREAVTLEVCALTDLPMLVDRAIHWGEHRTGARSWDAWESAWAAVGEMARRGYDVHGES